MDEEPIEEQPLGQNPEPEVLRKDNEEDALLAQGIKRDEQIDKMIEQAANPPEVEQLDVNEFLEDVDAGDAKDAGEQEEAQVVDDPKPPERLLPNGQGVDPAAIRAKRTERHQRAKQPAKQPVAEKAPEPEPKAMPEPVVPQPAKAEEPGLASQALAWAIKRAAELGQPLPLAKEVDRPLGGPDNRDEPIAVDMAINPLGNDKDLNNRILEMLRQYLDQERMYKNSLFNILSEALNMLRSDHVRLENLEAAFERDREAY